MSRFRQVAGVVAVLGVVVLAVVVFTGPAAGLLAQMRSGALELGVWFPLVFFLTYTVVTIFPIPRSTFTYSAAVLFVPQVAIPLCLIATACSAALAFSGVRALGYRWARRLADQGRLARLDSHIQRRGWLAVASLRMVPAVPFSLLNYAAALSSIRFNHFLPATIIGSTPGTIAAIILADGLTTGSGPGALWATALFTAVGITGLIVDARLPVRPVQSQSRPAAPPHP